MKGSAAMDHDAIVVGTGYGGASAAAVLARAGLRVGILERGTWWGAFGGHRPLPETLPQVMGATEFRIAIVTRAPYRADHRGEVAVGGAAPNRRAEIRSVGREETGADILELLP